MISWKIAKQTFQGCLNQPFFIVAEIFFVLFSCALPLIAQFSFFHQQKMIIESCLGLTVSLTTVVIMLLTYKLFGEELRSQQSLIIFSKPVAKSCFISGKVLGIATAVWIYIILCFVATNSIIDALSSDYHINFVRLGSQIAILFSSLFLAGMFNFYAKVNFSKCATVLLISFFAVNALFSKALISYPNLVNIFIYLGLGLMILFSLNMWLASRWQIGIQITTTLLFIVVSLTNKIPVLPNFGNFWIIDRPTTQATIGIGLIILTVLIYNLIFYILTLSYLGNKEIANR